MYELHEYSYYYTVIISSSSNIIVLLSYSTCLILRVYIAT